MKGEVQDDDFIPGTVNIYAFEINKDDINDTETPDGDNNQDGLKTRGNIILVPQPTESVNDPLNWSITKKLWNFSIVIFYTAFTAATSNDAGATQDSLNELYGISYDAMNTGAGVLFVSIGTGAFVLAPAASLYGRKIAYFICILLGLVGAVWFALAKTTSDTIWSQLFVGVSESVAETQVQLSISDLFFQHQLGASVTVYIIAASTGTYLGPLIAGFITEYTTFRWVGWIAVIISGGLLLVVVFGMHETAFERGQYDGVLNAIRSSDPHDLKNKIDDLVTKDIKVDSDQKKESQLQTEMETDSDIAPMITGVHDVKKSYWEEIKMITLSSNTKGTGFKQYLNQLRHLFRIFMFPPVIYSGLVWGIQDVLLTFYLTVEDDQYYDPPYNYGNVGVALMNVPCLIGAIIGCFYAGHFSDQFVIWRARRRGGIQEAEDRLWFLFIPAVVAPIGLIIFGAGTDLAWSWVPSYIGLGMVGFGFACSGDISISYLMEAYPEMVNESMAGVAIINNYLSCVFTFTCSLWLEKMSATHTFIILGVLEFIIMMGAAPMIIYGKRLRVWTKPWYIDYCEYRDGI